MPITNTKAKWANGNLLFNNLTASPSPVYVIEEAFTVTQVNAGATILAAVAGIAYRMVSCKMVAYGGAVGSVTTIDILGTQTTSQKLVAYAQASLTESTVLADGDSGAAVLADGASYAVCDAGAAITIGKTGAAADTATGVIVTLAFAMEHA